MTSLLCKITHGHTQTCWLKEEKNDSESFFSSPTVQTAAITQLLAFPEHMERFSSTVIILKKKAENQIADINMPATLRITQHCLGLIHVTWFHGFLEVLHDWWVNTVFCQTHEYIVFFNSRGSSSFPCSSQELQMSSLKNSFFFLFIYNMHLY